MIVTSEGSIIRQGPANASLSYPAWSQDSRWCFCFLEGRTPLSGDLAQDGFVAISAFNVKTPAVIKTYPLALQSQGKVSTLAGYYERPVHNDEPVIHEGPRNPHLPDFHFGSVNDIVLVYPDGDFLPADNVIFEAFHIADTSKSITTPTRLVPDGWDFDSAAFSPKGDSIVWKFRRENNVELWISDEKGGNLKRIGKFYAGEIKHSTNGRLSMVEPYSLKWLPGGKAISFREAGEFYVVYLDRKKSSQPLTTRVLKGRKEMQSVLPPWRLSLICSALCISTRFGSAAAPLPTQAVHARSSKTLRLVWKASFAGQQILNLGPSGTDKVIVFTAPPWDAKKGDWNAWPRNPIVIDLETGTQVKQPQITGFRGEALADDKRWYAVIPLPLPHSASHQITPQDFQAELVAFDWTNGREAWHIPCQANGEPLVLDTLLFHTRIDGSGNPDLLIAMDPSTGQERWHRPVGSIHGMFLANNRLYVYNEAQDTGVADTGGQFLNALDLATGEPLQRIRFYPEFRPLSSLGSLAWFPASQRLIGTFEVHTPGQDVVDIRALDAAGKLVWSRSDTSGFHVVNDVLVCESKGKGIVALNPATGHEQWRHPGNDYTFLSAWKDTFVVRAGVTLLGLDAHTGKTAWTLPIPSLPQDSLPTVSRRRGGVPRPGPTELSVRAYGPYLALAQTRPEGHSAALYVYTLPDR